MLLIVAQETGWVALIYLALATLFVVYGVYEIKERARRGALGPDRTEATLPKDDLMTSLPSLPRCWSDANTDAEPPASFEEGLQRYSAVVQEKLASMEEEGRRLAYLLMSEIALYDPELVEKTRKGERLPAQLVPDVERARSMFNERIPAEERRDYFQEAIVQVLGDGDPAVLQGLPVS